MKSRWLFIVLVPAVVIGAWIGTAGTRKIKSQRNFMLPTPCLSPDWHHYDPAPQTGL